MLRHVLILAIACVCLQAQEYRSTMTGRITDPSGSAVPGAKVTATKIDTNTKFPTVAGPEGFYTIPQLPPGTYELSAESAGFKKYVQTGIAVASDVRVGVDVRLQIGDTRESVTVTEDAPALNTVSASAGQSI